MKLWAGLLPGVSAILLCLSLNGCMPSDQGQLEEEKEAHFMAGRSCVNSMDYQGAIEEFEKALEVNPHSASAHFQLGTLYEEKEPDPAAAIYHYEQYLKLCPNSDYAEVIRQHITNCRQDLAKTVLPLPITPVMQRRFDQLADETRRLRDENNRWKAYFASLPQSQSNQVAQLQAVPAPAQLQATSPPTLAPAANPNSASRQASVAGRSHTVQSGDTAYSISRKYGVKLEALMAVNPGLDPRRLRVGQVVKIP